MAEVEIFHWNPARPVFPGRLGRRIPIRRPLDNFGDLLGPLIVEGARRRAGIGDAPAARDAQLLSIGSVLHFARPGAVVWGTGINGKVDDGGSVPPGLDVRAVRGPVTRAVLLKRGVDVPEVYGDPGLLLPVLHPELVGLERRHAVTIVPNLNDLPAYRGVDVLNPRRPLWECLRTIGSSELVVGSSLHGIIVAEALGVPARLVVSGAEHRFKYDDYYAGTGRTGYVAAQSVAEAIELGGERPPQWSPEPLLEAFPADLWVAVAPD